MAGMLNSITPALKGKASDPSPLRLSVVGKAWIGRLRERWQLSDANSGLHLRPVAGLASASPHAHRLRQRRAPVHQLDALPEVHITVCGGFYKSTGQRHAGCGSGNDLNSRSMAASGLPAHSSEGSPAHAQRQGRFAAARAQQAYPCTAAAAGPTREKHKLVLHQLRQHGYVDALKRADNLAWRAVQMAEALRWGRAEKRSVSKHACAACLYGWRMHLHSWCHNCHARQGTGWLAWLTSMLRAASVATASRQAGSCCRHSTPG